MQYRPKVKQESAQEPVAQPSAKAEEPKKEMTAEERQEKKDKKKMEKKDKKEKKKVHFDGAQAAAQQEQAKPAQQSAQPGV